MRSQAGLTLIEILIVLIILGSVMGVVVGKVFQSKETALVDLTKLRLEQVKSDIEQFRLRYNSLPKSIEGLTRCTETTGQGCVPITDMQSLEDAWGNLIKYSSNGKKYKIQSLGADGAAGGEGVNYDFFIEGP